MSTPAKLDLLKTHRRDYVAPKRPVLINLAPARYLSISGQGRPGDDLFAAQVGALYAIAFTTKMRRKFAGQGDYTIGKLEARWPGFVIATPPPWTWELLIRTPDAVTDDDLKVSATTLTEKGHGAEVGRVRLTTIDEGPCVQMLHTGPYDQETTTLSAMTEFAAKSGLKPGGPHHEIYLSDPRRVPPARLRTILRLPLTAV